MTLASITSVSTAIASAAALSTSVGETLPTALNSCSSFFDNSSASMKSVPASISVGIFSNARPVAVAAEGTSNSGIPMLMSAAYAADPTAKTADAATNVLTLVGGAAIMGFMIVALFRFIYRQADAEQNMKASVVSDWQPDGEAAQKSDIAGAMRPKSAMTGTSLPPPKDSGHHHGGTGIH